MFAALQAAACSLQVAHRLTSAVAKWDHPTVILRLDTKRRLTVPASLAPTAPGDYFEAHFDAEEDALVFRRLAGKENWLEVLKACPVSPDDVPRRRTEAARRTERFPRRSLGRRPRAPNGRGL